MLVPGIEKHSRDVINAPDVEADQVIERNGSLLAVLITLKFSPAVG